MSNAQTIPCLVLYKPTDTRFQTDTRRYQGCPTLAVTRGGRIFMGWYAGGIGEPHMHNYNLVIYSDDGGETWTQPYIVIPSSYTHNIHALDIQMFMDPDGVLHIQWVQNNAEKLPNILPQVRPDQPLTIVDGYLFTDFQHSEWEITCADPDAPEPVFSAPRYVYPGFLRCKPTFLRNGDWLCFSYDQLNGHYGYCISEDGGKTFSRHYGAKKLETYYDEAMAYQLEDGRIRMFARTKLGELAECWSYDNGRTWTDAVLSGIVAANGRFFVKKLPSGRVLLIVNADREVRTNLTLMLSEDDGVTWKYQVCIDGRFRISYPDADDRDGRIYLAYDRNRQTDMEIMFTSFTEEDIIQGNTIPFRIINKPSPCPSQEEVSACIEESGLIAILRNIPRQKLLPLAQTLYDNGVKLLEIPFSADGKVSDEETAEGIRLLVDHFEGKLYVGAGTVLTEEQVRLTKLAGGCFALSPHADEAVIRESYRCGLVSIPGAMTPTEIQSAISWGADFVKLFPASVLGPDYIRAVRAPLSHAKLLAVGGINLENIPAFQKAGAVGFGLGSNIIEQSALDREDYAAIGALAKEFLQVIHHG